MPGFPLSPSLQAAWARRNPAKRRFDLHCSARRAYTSMQSTWTLRVAARVTNSLKVRMVSAAGTSDSMVRTALRSALVKAEWRSPDAYCRLAA